MHPYTPTPVFLTVEDTFLLRTATHGPTEIQMVRKTPKSAAPDKPAPDSTPPTFGMPLPGHLKDSAQQIWLAGLGAFSKVQAEGGKVFDTLVNDGLNLQRQTQAMAEERIKEASSRFSLLGSELTTRATGSMDKLEHIFEDRVAKALHKLGIPSAHDMAALLARIEELQREVLRLTTAATPAPSRSTAASRRAATAPASAAARQPAAKSPARKAPARKTAARKP
jgi:poly(hydroxyalkanoate) granule-associated protein